MQTNTKSGNDVGSVQPQRYDNWQAEYKLFEHYLRNNTATSTMVSVALNIYRPNSCRYKRWLQEAGKLWEVRKGICAVTGFPAKYLSTNPAMKPEDPQYKLFADMEGANS